MFEAAIHSNHKIIRIDILDKKAKHYQLIEVKSKSFDSKADRKTQVKELKKYIERQNEKIQTKLHKLSVAPAEEGKWKNWGADLYLEEKLFPALFPYGWGGFLSTCLLYTSDAADE